MESEMSVFIYMGMNILHKIQALSCSFNISNKIWLLTSHWGTEGLMHASPYTFQGRKNVDLFCFSPLSHLPQISHMEVLKWNGCQSLLKGCTDVSFPEEYNCFSSFCITKLPMNSLLLQLLPLHSSKQKTGGLFIAQSLIKEQGKVIPADGATGNWEYN